MQALIQPLFSQVSLPVVRTICLNVAHHIFAEHCGWLLHQPVIMTLVCSPFMKRNLLKVSTTALLQVLFAVSYLIESL
ncbi:hypothetical protein Psfp_02618 [Pelotomaculum sp. FP]|nr:hypothetical protein Psfp_02618 [Pelotomaculum sp. FP]